MMKARFGVSIILMALAGLCRAQTHLELVLAAERHFARVAADSGTRMAFLRYMDDSAMVSREGRFTFGRPVYEAAPARRDTLLWEPDMVDASLAGDLGFTSGPWHMMKGGKQVATGWFNTIWKRQADDTYRFVLDMGTEGPVPTSGEEIKVFQQHTRGVRTFADRRELFRADSAFARQLPLGSVEVYEKHLSKEARLLRPGLPPIIRNEAIIDYLHSEPVRRFAPQGGDIAEKGDLGYVYGMAEPLNGKGKAVPFLRIWKREPKGWRIVLEVVE